MRWNAPANCIILLALTVALTRFATRSHFLYDLDSVNFALALDHFDPAAHQPHPPGYFLYVLLGRLARLLIADSNNALVAISIAASCGAAVLIYLFTLQWFGHLAARIAGVLFLCSPLCWFHGTVALTYMVECFFSAAIGYLCWRSYKGCERSAMAAAALLGAAGGFRQSSALFLTPLLLLSTWRFGRSGIVRILLVLVAVTAAWFVPMLFHAGGYARYFGALWDLWTIVPGTASVAQSGLLLSLARLFTIVFILLLCFGPALLVLLLRTSAAGLPRERRTFLLVWIMPALLFFTLVFLKFVNSGYLLVIAPPIFIVLGGRAAAWWQWQGKGLLRVALASASLAAGIATYFFAPLYCSFASVRGFEQYLAGISTCVRSAADPATTAIVSFDSHFMGYRHATYYLPEFLVLQYPEVKYRSGTRVFLSMNRRTEVLPRAGVGNRARVVFFPLPREESYREFTSRVLALLPAGAITRRSCGGNEIHSAGAAALAKLFPTTF
ncbi:MAG TPA: DUF2723 domain-containing protein [Bryobacteraceae bacterium]|nr:DUF2723 domain-containing protein [Bryobacteraceae bacterium]